MGQKLPFLKFFPNDWLAEPSIRSCSVGARGLWIDMLSLMHLSPRRGYLLAATGLPLSLEQLARLTGCSTEEATRLLMELKSSGACSCTDDGTIYSRRMVREEQKREKCSEAGRKGGGNPNLPTFKGRAKGSPKGEGKGESKPLEARSQSPDPPYPPEGGKPVGCDLPSIEELSPKVPRFAEVREAWNAIEGVVHCKHDSQMVHTLFGARAMNPDWCRNWRSGIEAVRRSPRCQGKTGWRADLEWFLKDGTLEKLLNGSFDDPELANRPPAEPSKPFVRQPWM